VIPRAPLALALVLVLPACGHKGDPLPPKRRTPPPPTAFRLAQRGESLELRADVPAASVDGVPLQEVELEFLHTTGEADLERKGTRTEVPATGGRRVVKELPLPPAGTLVRAAARVRAGREKGSKTLTLALTVQPVVEPPSDLEASLTENGVALAWRGPRPRPATTPPASGLAGTPSARPPSPGPAPASPPAASPATPSTTPPTPAAPPVPAAAPPAAAEESPPSPPASPAGPSEEPTAEPRQSGFLVYRRAGGSPYEPLFEEPLERRSHRDTTAPLGKTVCYVVRAAASIAPLIESAPSNESCVSVRDIAPPATPGGLAVLPREGGLELLWSPSSEPDLAGYRVYRSEAGAAEQKVAEVPPARPSWLDASAERGVRYRYSITAFDQAGNESPHSEPVEATRP
jgi:hypothetical protein